jgi:ribA/ribD-fused uncharacterized protein
MNNPVRFWRTTGTYGCFSNFSRHPVTYRDMMFATSEHLYHWLKFGDNYPETETTVQKQIRMSSLPKESKTIANNNKHLWFYKNWHDVKYDTMVFVCMLKCQQHLKVKDVLLQTGEAEIVEASPYDYEWGCGADGSGKNLLGKAWMQVRSAMREKDAKTNN